MVNPDQLDSIDEFVNSSMHLIQSSIDFNIDKQFITDSKFVYYQRTLNTVLKLGQQSHWIPSISWYTKILLTMDM